MGQRRRGGPAARAVVVQQVLFDVTALVFGLGQRLRVIGGLELARSLAQRRERSAPCRRVVLRRERTSLTEQPEAEQAMIGLRIRRDPGPAQDAYRGGALPAALVDARQRHLEPHRCVQANYRAVQAVSQVGVGELGMRGTGVDADAQVDVAFANFEQVGSRVELASHGVRPRAADHHLGRIFDQRLGLEAAAAAAKAQHPGGTQVWSRARRCFWYVFMAPAQARMTASPLIATPMFTGTCAAPQRKIENGGRVCSKSLIENTLSL